MSKGMSIISGVLLVGFIGLVFFGWYEMLSTPQTRLSIFLAGFVIFLWTIMYTIGEFMGFAFKQKNFITEGGAVGVYMGREHYEGGMSKYYVAVPKRYAYDNGLKPRPRHIGDVMGSALTPSTVIEVVGKTSDFEEVDTNYCDAREGAIIYRGTLNPDRRVPSRYEVMRSKIEQYESLLSQLASVFEGAKAQAAGLTQEDNTNLVSAAIKGSVIVQNFQKAMQPRQQQNMNQMREM